MNFDGRMRVVIEDMSPQIDCGRYPVKRVVGDEVVVEANVFADGHDEIAVSLLVSRDGGQEWTETAMSPAGNDRWRAAFTVEEVRTYTCTVHAWLDHFKTWQKSLQKRFDAGQDLKVEFEIGSNLLKNAAIAAIGPDKAHLEAIMELLASDASESRKVQSVTATELTTLVRRCGAGRIVTESGTQLKVVVDRIKAGFSTWYEIFPRSCSYNAHGNFNEAAKRLPDIAGMGFDVLYLPPIHPIGEKSRKGRNNSITAAPDDPGSPWAIGSKHGGHKAVNPALGTIKDFENFVKTAEKLGMEVAIDLAFQCAPDHPYVREHEEWFSKRPDGTIQYAENPPKKYEDIVPFNFECDQWKELWEELKSVVEFWMDKGIRIFRVDNPHTKPFSFWEWLIGEIQRDNPDVLFLAEAFTRPRVMERLAKAGFTQSYTYFTWRNTKREITEYMNQLTQTPLCEYFRPNFWPSTPDILPEFLQYGGRPAFVLRAALAATLSPNYGVYGPAYELCAHEALPDREEYSDSEKFQVYHWDHNRPDSLAEFLTHLNRIRRENPALQQLRNIKFYETDNDFLLLFAKVSQDTSNIIIVVANLDPFHKQAGWVSLPLDEFDMSAGQTYLVDDLIAGDKYVWNGERNFVELDPAVMPVHIFRLHRRLRREQDFDYYL